jgi:hypothetical protein
MNKQEVFNQVYEHLLDQGEVCTGPEGCAYRGRDGNKPNGKSCAIGCLIADEHYSEDLESLTPQDIRIVEALKASGIVVDVLETDSSNHGGNKDGEVQYYSRTKSPDVMFLWELQDIHDNTDPGYWQTKLKQFANEQALTVPAL